MEGRNIKNPELMQCEAQGNKDGQTQTESMIRYDQTYGLQPFGLETLALSLNSRCGSMLAEINTWPSHLCPCVFSLPRDCIRLTAHIDNKQLQNITEIAKASYVRNDSICEVKNFGKR